MPLRGKVRAIYSKRNPVKTLQSSEVYTYSLVIPPRPQLWLQVQPSFGLRSTKAGAEGGRDNQGRSLHTYLVARRFTRLLYFKRAEKRVDSSTRLTSARLDLSVCRVKVPAGVIPGS